MRYGVLAVLMFVAAVLWAGCCKGDKVCTATNTLNAMTLTVQETEAQYKRAVKDRLLVVAGEERDLRTKELGKAGCPTDPAQVKTPECDAIVSAAKAHYEGRKGKLVTAATKLDAATGLAYGALLTAVDLLIVIRDGAKDKWPALSSLIAEAVKVGQALASAWADFKQQAPTY